MTPTTARLLAGCVTSKVAWFLFLGTVLYTVAVTRRLINVLSLPEVPKRRRQNAWGSVIGGVALATIFLYNGITGHTPGYPRQTCALAISYSAHVAPQFSPVHGPSVVASHEDGDPLVATP